MKMSIPGLETLQANNIFCIGRNYALHAREMGSDLPEEPMVFLKPNSALIYNGGTVRIPMQSGNVHHEVELVIAIGKKGSNISLEKADEYIAGVGIGIDMTARDLQQNAKSAGHPWTVSKGFDTFAPLGRMVPPEKAGSLGSLTIELKRNGEIVQQGETSEMIFPVYDLISRLSEIFTLQPGDLIYTGTPEGVGPVQPGDKLSARLNDNLSILNVDVT